MFEAQRIDFQDTSHALTTVRAISATFDEVVLDGDREAIKAAYSVMADAIAGVTRLVLRLGAGLGRAAMGSPSFPPEWWKDRSAEEILNELCDLVAIDDLAIEMKQKRVPGAGSAEAKRLAREVARMIRVLKSKVSAARTWIIKRFPDHWGDQQEEDFRRWL